MSSYLRRSRRPRPRRTIEEAPRTAMVAVGGSAPGMQCARDAVGGMIDLLSVRHRLRPVDASLLCSVCADLWIGEIVDLPSWVVSPCFPRVVLE